MTRYEVLAVLVFVMAICVLGWFIVEMAGRAGSAAGWSWTPTGSNK